MQLSNHKRYLLHMLLKLCVTGILSAGEPEAGHHTWRTLDSCLEWSQHSPHSSALGLWVLLCLPRADELLLWEYHPCWVTPVALGPEADSAGNFWRPGDLSQGWKEGCCEGWVLGWYTLSLQGFQLSKKGEDDWEEQIKAILLSRKGLRQTDLFARSGGRLTSLRLR